jgi:hypothetical protein
MAGVAGSLTCHEKQPTLFLEWNVLQYGWHWQAVGLANARDIFLMKTIEIACIECPTSCLSAACSLTY